MSITRVLVANRGEIVSRVARSAHRRGIEVVAVFADSDLDGEYLKDADLSISLGDDRTSSPYLDSALLVAAARRAGCDAVHPGFGFLAENARFAEQVSAAGLIWIGPSPSVIDMMGGKVEAKKAAALAGVPVLPSVEVADSIDDAIAKVAESLLPPLLVKPSAGGGGKGMHRVEDMSALRDVLIAAGREAQASFGDGSLFVEQYIEFARHIEVQVVADQHGNVVHLGTRDCSVQRRHQKIVEEAPAPGLPEPIRSRACESAADLARRIGYSGVGTVEYLAFDDDFAFLEMNTRLQVEHPVTEEVTGIDLVDLQFTIAEGSPLPIAQDDVRIAGHSLEVRLYAEDPPAGFLPSPGRIDVLELPPVEGIRWELGVASGSVVSSRYDPMIAKIIAAGPTRNQARNRLLYALRRLAIHGVKTNADLLIAVLGHADFADARLSTRFLEDHPDLVRTRLGDGERATHVVAALLTQVLDRRRQAGVWTFTPPGWRNVRSGDAVETFRVDGDEVEVRYRLLPSGQWRVVLGSREVTAVVRAITSDVTDIVVDDVRRPVRVLPIENGYLVSSGLGRTAITRVTQAADGDSAAPGSLLAPLPGVVVSVERSAGDSVEIGDTLMVLEAMKMEHHVRAPQAGSVQEVLVRTGDVVQHDQLLAILSGPS